MEIKSVLEYTTMIGSIGTVNVLFVYDEGNVLGAGYLQAIKNATFGSNVRIYVLNGTKYPEVKKSLGYYGTNIIIYFKNGSKRAGPVYMAGGNIDIVWKINDDIRKYGL